MQDRKDSIPEEAEAQQIKTDATLTEEVSEEIPKVVVVTETEGGNHSSKHSSSDERDAT